MNNTLTIGVDLLPLRPDGSNGGVKPAIFEFLSWIMENKGSQVSFVLFSNSQTQHELRHLCRDVDSTVCLMLLDGVEALPSEVLTKHDFNRVGEQLQALEEFPVDLIYAPFGPTSLSYPGVPVISMIVDLLHKDFPASLPGEEIAHRNKYFEDIVNRSGFIQVISEYTKSRLVHHYDVPKDRVFVTHLPIHSRLSILEKGNNPPLDSPYFFYPANFLPHKNHESLLIAYNNYLRRCGDDAWKLVLTGPESPKKEQNKEVAESLGIQNHVVFLKYISQEELESYWSHAGALVFPSLHEGFGIPVLEAMHYEIPVVCHEGTSLTEVGGDACHYCDCRNPLNLAEALLKISSDASWREELVERGKKQLGTFDLNSIMQELFDKMRLLTETADSPLTSLGIYQDGWMEKRCLFNLPKKLDRTEITVELFPFPEDRYLSLFLDEYPYGSHDLQKNAPNTISFAAYIEGQNLKIEANDTTRLSEVDQRSFGVRIKSISLSPNNREPIQIFSVR